MNLKELARLLNLSPTTVSRALNGYPEVNEATRERVLQAVRRTRYRPNRAAQRLATGKAGSIGLVLPMGPDRDTDLHFAELMSGIGEVARAHDVQIVLTPSRAGEESTTFERMVAGGNIDVLSLTDVEVDDPRIKVVDALNIPYVVHGRDASDVPDYPYLDVDNTAAFRDAAEHLLALGHTRFALLNGHERLGFARRRRQGLCEALGEAGLSLDPALSQHSAMTEEHGYRGMMRFLDHEAPPTAVLCSSVIMALGATRAIRQRALAMGQDISLVVFDDVFPYLKPENFSTPLTTMTSSIRAAGARVAERLIGDPELRANTLRQELWKAELMPRASSGRAASPRSTRPRHRTAG